MPEMKKRIAIASVLKPLNDSRMTEKLACSLAENTSYEVHVIAFPSALPADSRITFHTFAAFKRLSIGRWLASFRILKIILRVKPAILIVTTHELLITALAIKLLLRTKIIYDVQENYYLNVLYTRAFPRILRMAIATYVRLKEIITARFIDHFFLAEKIYATQLPFLRSRFSILENKFTGTTASNIKRTNTQLIFSGTLSRSTGLFRAIELARKLQALDGSVTLTLIGYVTLQDELVELKRLTADSPFITLIGGGHLVSHPDILTKLQEAGAGVIAYELNPATKGRVPTKLYEYAGSNLPVILIQPDPMWAQTLSDAGHPFLEITGEERDLTHVVHWLKSGSDRGTLPAFMQWKNEEIKLWTAISGL